jgi:glycosyltransferase involved in cell wall biosynthesis
VVEVADRLRRTFSEAGVKTHLLVCNEDTYRDEIQTDPVVTNVWRFQIPSYAFHRLSLKAIAAMLIRGSLALWRIFRFLQSHQVRTIVLIYPFGYAWPFLLLRRTVGIRLITILQGNDITRYADYPTLSQWLLRCVLRGSDAIIACADHLAQKAQELFPGMLLPIRVIPNCVDVNHFVPSPPNFNKHDDRPTLVHVSNFAPKKRTLDIIEAFAIAAIPPNSRLVMVGAGSDLEAAIKRSRNLGMDHRVEFVGLQNDVRPYLWQADVFIMASDDEGAPQALLEAMACGLPWVSTAWGAAAVLPLGECGLVVPSRSPHQLAAAMAELINDPQRRYLMGLRGRHRAKVDFGEDKYVERHLQVIQNVEPNGTAPELLRRSPKLLNEGQRRHP